MVFNLLFLIFCLDLLPKTLSLWLCSASYQSPGRKLWARYMVPDLLGKFSYFRVTCRRGDRRGETDKPNPTYD